MIRLHDLGRDPASTAGPRRHEKPTRHGSLLQTPAGTTRRDIAHTMRTALEGVAKGITPIEALSGKDASKALLENVRHWLDEAKAEEIVVIDLEGKTTIGDFMVIATGRTDRHVGAIADQLQRKLKETGLGRTRVEGTEACDWVLIDTGDLIIHVFRPEVRDFYNLEKMWSADRPGEATAH